MTTQLTPEQLSQKPSGSNKMNQQFVIGLIAVAIFIGILLILNPAADKPSITGQVVGQVKPTKIVSDNVCMLGGIVLEDYDSNYFPCNSNLDCLYSIKEFHEYYGTPVPSQIILESIECKFLDVEVFV